MGRSASASITSYRRDPFLMNIGRRKPVLQAGILQQHPKRRVSPPPIQQAERFQFRLDISMLWIPGFRPAADAEDRVPRAEPDDRDRDRSR